MSLSEFMPYGAPELLEGAAPRMARSTMLATGLVVVLTWSAGLIATRQAQVIELPPIIEHEPRWQPPPKFFDDTAVPEPHVPPAPPTDPDAIVEIVPEAPPVEPTTIEPGFRDPAAPPGRGLPDASHDGAIPTPGDWGAEPPIDSFVVTDVQPELVGAKDPVYPELAVLAGVEGTVIVRMLVGLDGHVVRAVVYPPGPATMLDEAALTAARTSVFTPALANGHPVKVWVSRPYRFKLH